MWTSFAYIGTPFEFQATCLLTTDLPTAVVLTADSPVANCPLTAGSPATIALTAELGTKEDGLMADVLGVPKAEANVSAELSAEIKNERLTAHVD